MTAIVNTDFMRKACRDFRRLQHIVNKLAKVINFPCTLADMTFFLQDAGVVLLHESHTTGRWADNVIVLLKQIAKTEC